MSAELATRSSMTQEKVELIKRTVAKGSTDDELETPFVPALARVNGDALTNNRTGRLPRAVLDVFAEFKNGVHPRSVQGQSEHAFWPPISLNHFSALVIAVIVTNTKTLRHNGCYYAAGSL